MTPTSAASTAKPAPVLPDWYPAWTKELADLYFSCTIDMFVNTVFNYPSLSDVYKYAAYDGLGVVQRRAAAEAAG